MCEKSVSRYVAIDMSKDPPEADWSAPHWFDGRHHIRTLSPCVRRYAPDDTEDGKQGWLRRSVGKMVARLSSCRNACL